MKKYILLSLIAVCISVGYAQYSPKEQDAKFNLPTLLRGDYPDLKNNCHQPQPHKQYGEQHVSIQNQNPSFPQYLIKALRKHIKSQLGL